MEFSTNEKIKQNNNTNELYRMLFLKIAIGKSMLFGHISRNFRTKQKSEKKVAGTRGLNN